MSLKIAFAFALLCSAAAAQTATRLRVEYLETPLCIDELLPRFSFALSHPDRGVVLESFRIVVVEARPSGAVVWDSGRVAANSSLNIEYAGTPLTSDNDYRWSVTWWSSATSAPSTPASSTFSTALLAGIADGHGAQWIAPAAGANLLRAEFTLAALPRRARLYISGLGYYRSYVNGAPTDTHVMGAFTTFEQRVLYDTLDVTTLLVSGCNALGVALGRGWYNQTSIHSGPLSLWALLSVEMADGSRVFFGTTASPTQDGVAVPTLTPLAFTSTPGPVVLDEIYLGEHYDARLEQAGWAACAFANATAWLPSTPTRDATQNATFSAHTVLIEPDEIIAPVAVTEPEPNVFVVDFGRNMAGITSIRVVCPDGPQTIRIDYAETLKEDGTILQTYTYPYPLIMTSNFTCAGTGAEETYTTLFSQYGFQYAQITNYPGVPTPDSMTAFTVNSAVGSSGAFMTSNTLLNRIQSATRLASISNLMDVPTDCPQRERRGWLGDGQVSFETAVHNYDTAAFYVKWLRDIRDTQVHVGTGVLPDCAPFYNHGGLPADPAWSAAYPLVTAWAALYFADTRLIARHYAGIKAFVDSEVLQLNTTTNLLTWARYGDWCGVAEGANTSCHFTRPGLSTFYFIKGVEVLADIAETLGKADDAAHYSALLAASLAAYQTHLFNASASYYEDGFPVSQLVALELPGGLPPASHDAAFKALVAELETGARSGFPRAPSGGIVFQKYAYGALSRGGRMDLALDVMLAQNMPSVAFWLDASVQTTPATTLWERWVSTATAPVGSFNHIMNGGFGSWLFESVGGLGRVPKSASWSDLDITPPQVLPPRFNMSSASASIDTAMGLAEVDWEVLDPRSCGRVEEDAAAKEPTTLSFSCTGGVFTSVVFASFGTPIGATCPFSIDPSCHAPHSADLVGGLCVGKASCVIPASDALFGDSCPEVRKSLAVELAGTCKGAPAFSLNTRVPTGGRAIARIPIGARDPREVNVTEGGGVVWEGGVFMPAPGITNASAATGGYISFTVGGGAYAFVLHAAPVPSS